MDLQPTDLEALLKHPGLWRGRQQHHNRETLSSGYPELDAALPASGWPLGALTEIMPQQAGIGEFSLLQPALQSLTQQQQWVALIAPPHVPYAPALVNAGIALEQMLVVSPQNSENAFWAAEQLLRSGVFSAVVLWSSDNGDDRQQRRLQLAAEQGKAWAVCYRPPHTAKTASPAGLRMLLQYRHQSLQVDIIKNRGGRLHRVKLQAGSRTAEPIPDNTGNNNNILNYPGDEKRRASPPHR